MSNRQAHHTALTAREADRIVGGLSYPSKMPGTAWGISARRCITGSKLVGVEGSTCHGCYALKGNYRFDNVAQAHQRRLEALDDVRWIEAMIVLLRSVHGLDGGKPSRKVKQPGWHRWFDSGDLQSVGHLRWIALVANETPEIQHWTATQELKIVQSFTSMGYPLPPNLLVRVSATMVDGPAAQVWPHTSTVHHHAPAQGHACPAPTQGNYCADCRACWTPAVQNVSYHKH